MLPYHIDLKAFANKTIIYVVYGLLDLIFTPPSKYVLVTTFGFGPYEEGGGEK